MSAEQSKNDELIANQLRFAIQARGEPAMNSASAKVELNAYGFFSMVMFGAIYYIMPQLMGMDFPSPKLVRGHFTVAFLGILLIVLPLGLGGILEALKLQNPDVPFINVMKSTLPFLRVSTLGDLLLGVGHVIFLVNLVRIADRFYRPHSEAAYAAVTADLYKSGGARL